MPGIVRIAVFATFVVAMTLTPSVAQAHAAFVSSDPEPGAVLPNAPGVVVLRFSEPINVRLSRASVTAPNGQRFDGRATGSQEIRVRLSTDAPGVYGVSWTTVSIVDGHTLHGGFQFGVRATPGEGAEGATAVTPQLPDLAIAVARAVEYAALLMAVGMVVLRWLAAREPSLSWVRLRLSVPLRIAFVAGLTVVLGEAFTAASEPSIDGLAAYLGAEAPGMARLTRLMAEAAAVSLSTAAVPLEAAPLALALLALASAGHAAAIRPAWSGIAADFVHLAAVGVWAGGILAFATLRPPEGWRGKAALAVLERFSPIALVAFMVTVATGTVRATQELSNLGDLLGSSYGQVLTAKVLGVVAMIPFSLRAWLRRSPAPRLEAGIALLVVAAAALLAAFPLPPGRVREAESIRERPLATVVFPQAGELTLGGNAGNTLVGLTLRPGQPGQNEVWVYLLPLEGEEAAAGINARILANGAPLDVRGCGPACRTGRADLRGGERIEVRVAGKDGGVALFALPDLPAPDGRTLLEPVQDRMHRLRTYRVEEVLGPADPPVRTIYMFQAPDRMRMEVSNGFQQVSIGAKRYLRNRPDSSWRVEEPAAPIEIPRFIWDIPDIPGSRSFIAPRLVGAETADGVQTQILSFFEQIGSTPIWFRLWVDAEGLVQRAEMRAQGHFMDQRYFDFDAPFTIESPPP